MLKNNTFCLIFLFLLFIDISDAKTIYVLMPRPKTANERIDVFGVSSATKIVIPDNPSKGTQKAAIYFQNFVNQTISAKPRIISESQFTGAGRVIFIGEIGSSTLIKNKLESALPKGEKLDRDGGYILDVTTDRILLIGKDEEGTFNGIATLAQLLIPNPFGSCAVQNCHIWDYPDYPLRWAFVSSNLRGTNAITRLNKILDTMAYRKMNGIQHNDFKYNILEDQPDYYFDSVQRFKNLCDDRLIEIVPGTMNIGWSSGILYKYPWLAEGLPTKAEYIIESDTGRLIPDTRVNIPNGNFETINGNGKFTGWNFYDENFATQDKDIFHSGNASAKCTNFDGSNSRFNVAVNCQPFRGYVLSAWFKTQDFNGSFSQLLVLGQNPDLTYRGLTFSSLYLPSTTNGWQRVEVTFNTLNFSKVLLYCGVWGANSGTIWWDDFEIRDIGLTNIIRRSGTPLHVFNKSTSEANTEGRDFEQVIDNIMLQSGGEFGPFHQPPTFKIIPNGHIKNGDTISISSYHPFTSVSDNQGNGSVMVCISEDTLYSILRDQTTRVNNLYHPKMFFMEHDEIRNMNWDSSCLKRNETPAILLSDNMNKCKDIIKNISSEAKVFMWSDMIDSLHNAYNNYYLINGDLTNIWNRIDTKSIIIANWNGGKMNESLRWFAKKGFSQISSPYYDDQSTNNIRQWRLAQIGVENIKGMMYTTWADDYNFLTPFSYYAWGAGPAIYHKPYDSTVLVDSTNLNFIAKVLPDPFDLTDSITYVAAIFEYENEVIKIVDTLQLFPTTKNEFTSNRTKFWHENGFKYRISALNAQGLWRETPLYEISGEYNMGIKQDLIPTPTFSMSISPNPSFDAKAEIDLFMPEGEDITIKVFNVLGNEISTLYEGPMDIGKHSLPIEMPDSGIYFCKLISKNFYSFKQFIICK